MLHTSILSAHVSRKLQNSTVIKVWSCLSLKFSGFHAPQGQGERQPEISDRDYPIRGSSFGIRGVWRMMEARMSSNPRQHPIGPDARPLPWAPHGRGPYPVVGNPSSESVNRSSDPVDPSLELVKPSSDPIKPNPELAKPDSDPVDPNSDSQNRIRSRRGAFRGVSKIRSSFWGMKP
uniref:Uncharacterized protein n=1 Tax=Candidatus Kentrum eta TaxID=2126337 RepID=A0A450VAC9_9GAMM|nr:MAG: hypothetical protein BECKH772A_GA0070896_102383 [Candidatus Kentron sp. H]